MNLQQLKYLSVLAQTQNYTQAAKILSITQPTLSHSMASLESELGIQLFERQGRNVVLTKAGRLFNEGALNTLQMLHTTVEETQKFKDEKDQIILSAVRPLFHAWLPQVLKKFLESYPNPTTRPNFTFEKSGGFSPKILASLQTEHCDIAFCSKIDAYSEIDYYPILEQKFVLITPSDHPLAQRESIDLVDTLPYDQITFSVNSGLNFETTRLFSLCGGAPKSVYAVEEDEAVAGLVAAGFGIAVVPEMPVLETMPVAAIPIRFPESRRLLYMATLKRHYQNPSSQALIDFVKATTKEK